MFQRRRPIYPINYPDYSTIRKWVLVILFLIVIAVIWIFYFTYYQYLGANGAKVSGFIYYRDHSVAGVPVVLGSEETVSDENGYFIISGVKLGKRQLEIKKDRFLPLKKSVFVWKKNIVLKKINITRDPNYSSYFTGQVFDNFTKKPIEGALVYLNRLTDATDQKGWFEFEDVGVGNALLRISAIGFEDKTENIALKEGENAEQEYYLAPYGKVSFTSARDGVKNVYTINYDGSALRNLTGEYKEDSWGAQFTPDGGKIVFYSTLDKQVDLWGQKIAYLYYMNIDGSDLKKVTDKVVPEGNFVVSNDGQRVVFLGKEAGAKTPDIYLVGIGSNQEWKQITKNDYYESDLDISPDGSRILYSAFVDGVRGLFLVDTATFKEKRLTQSQGYEHFASFSPDGESIVYTKEGLDFSSRIFVYNVAREEEKEIYKTSLQMSNLVWSNDGKQILFTSSRDNKTNIFVMDADGGNEIKLTKESADYRNIIWPSIEKILVFIVHGSDGNKLSVMDLSTRQIIPLEDVSDDNLSWAPQ